MQDILCKSPKQVLSLSLYKNSFTVGLIQYCLVWSNRGQSQQWFLMDTIQGEVDPFNSLICGVNLFSQNF